LPDSENEIFQWYCEKVRYRKILKSWVKDVQFCIQLFRSNALTCAL
jgi:hypothetical protein